MTEERWFETTGRRMPRRFWRNWRVSLSFWAGTGGRGSGEPLICGSPGPRPPCWNRFRIPRLFLGRLRCLLDLVGQHVGHDAHLRRELERHLPAAVKHQLDEE